MKHASPLVTLEAITDFPLDTIYLAARRCYAAGLECPELPETEDRDYNAGAMESTVLHAVESGHTSILEHASFTFHIEGISRACSHQLVRHRMASYAQQSQRYAAAQDAVAVPPSIKANENALRFYEDACASAMRAYEAMAALGIPKEDARYLLPQSVATSMIVTMNARELYEHFFPLRMCSRAQWEIREVARRMRDLILEQDSLAFLFRRTGASCDLLGYCPEGARGCGRKPSLKDLPGKAKEA